MKREKWIKWKPLNEIPQTLFCESIQYNYNGLIIKLQGKDSDSPILTINFEFFLSLRVMDEGKFLKDSCDIDEAVLEMELEQDSYYRWGLFTVENSPFLEWFHDQSVDTHRDIRIVHYVIRTPGDVIEILASVTPITEWN